MSPTFRLALVQLSVGANKAENLARCGKLVREAASNGAKVVALPECFNSPYGISHFREYAEKIPNGQTCETLSKLAKENDIYLIGGSIPELSEDESSVYNTCTIWSPAGELLGRHQKVHLFDIDIPGKITFKESQTLSRGSRLTTFKTPFCNIGIGICYELRFAEMAQLYREEGCSLLVYPGAFNMTTGPAHWQILQQARAVDNQLFVATISPARDEGAGYVAWGHSMAVDPWGKILAEADHTEQVVYADIDLAYMKEVREGIPLTTQRRTDLYQVISKVQE